MAHSKFISSKLDTCEGIHSTRWKRDCSRLPAESPLGNVWSPPWLRSRGSSSPWRAGYHTEYLPTCDLSSSHPLCRTKNDDARFADWTTEALAQSVWLLPAGSAGHSTSPRLLHPGPGAQQVKEGEGGGQPGGEKETQPCLGPTERAAFKVTCPLVGGRTSSSPSPSRTPPANPQVWGSTLPLVRPQIM